MLNMICASLFPHIVERTLQQRFYDEGVSPRNEKDTADKDNTVSAIAINSTPYFFPLYFGLTVATVSG